MKSISIDKRIITVTLLLPISLLMCSALSSDIVEDIKNHLQFLGYEIDDDGTRVFAKMTNEADIYIIDYESGLLLYTFYPLDQSADKYTLLQNIDMLNANASLCRYYLDVNNNLSLVVEFWFPDIYDRQIFGHIFNLWQDEARRNVYSNGINEFIIET